MECMIYTGRSSQCCTMFRHAPITLFTHHTNVLLFFSISTLLYDHCCINNPEVSAAPAAELQDLSRKSHISLINLESGKRIEKLIFGNISDLNPIANKGKIDYLIEKPEMYSCHWQLLLVPSLPRTVYNYSLTYFKLIHCRQMQKMGHFYVIFDER